MGLTQFTGEVGGCPGFTIGPLRRINIISGKNDTGKTALLGALYSYALSQGILATYMRPTRPNFLSSIHYGSHYGIALMDNVDHGVHYSEMPELWMDIMDVAREFDTQVFATTHSFECIEAAHSACAQDQDFAYHRLEWRGNELHAVTYDWETFQGALESNLEVR